MNLYHLVTALLAGAVVCFISGAEGSPHFQAPILSPLPMQVGLKCGLVNGRIECGDTNGGGKHHHNDDDDDQNGDNDDHHKKKNSDDSSGLETCTIQQPGGGGGCKSGFKRVCEKLKSNKKCCGCVPDKNAKTDPGNAKTDPGTNPNYSCCDGFGADGNKVGERLCGDITINKEILKNTYHATTITCTAQ